MTGHDRAIMRRHAQPLFREIRSMLIRKVDCDFSENLYDTDYEQSDCGTYKERFLLKDPSRDEKFLVRVDLTATPVGNGAKFTVELSTYSRQINRFGRLPTPDEVIEPDLIEPSAYIRLNRYTTKRPILEKGDVEKKIRADLDKTLQNGGDLDRALQKAKEVTDINIKTAKNLAIMQKAGLVVK